jgi:hypothetical protein
MLDRAFEQLQRAQVGLIQTAKISRCLKLLPFDKMRDELYAESIEPAIAMHMHPPPVRAAEKYFITVVGSAAVSSQRSEAEGHYAMAWEKNSWADSLRA